MSNAHRITIEQAEKLAGVSKNTLMRFADAGYFSVSHDEEQPLLLVTELCSLFSIPVPSEYQNGTSRPAYGQINRDHMGRSDKDYADTVSPASSERETLNVLSASNQDSLPDALEVADEDIFSSTDISSQAPSTEKASEAALLPAAPSEREVQLQEEVLKLQKVVSLQEQLLDLREAEIKDLKEQRRWLQERVERAEEKGERDQLLLISETQMLTKMYMQQLQKKSTLTMALEWLGLAKPQPLKTTTIDYQTEQKPESKEQQKAA